MLIFEIAVAACSIGVWAVLLKMAFSIAYPATATFWSGGGSFPAILCVVLICLNLWWIGMSVYKLRAEKSMAGEVEAREGEERERESIVTSLFGDHVQRKRLLVMMLITLVYIKGLIPIFGSLTYQFGFSLATFVYLFVAIKLFGSCAWLKTVIISMVTTALIYVTFTYLLLLPMPR